MPIKDQFIPKPQSDAETTPFETAEDAWFWFIQAQQARNEGAKLSAGAGYIIRPCEPVDILRVLDKLHRNRRLHMEHLMILRHYGRRMLAPDPRRVKEARAFHIWKEALERIEPILVRKGIVRAKKLTLNRPNKFWSHGAVVYIGDHVQESEAQ